MLTKVFSANGHQIAAYDGKNVYDPQGNQLATKRENSEIHAYDIQGNHVMTIRGNNYYDREDNQLATRRG